MLMEWKWERFTFKHDTLHFLDLLNSFIVSNGGRARDRAADPR